MSAVTITHALPPSQKQAEAHRSLWQAVIYQAIDDAVSHEIGKPAYGSTKHEAEEAHSWIFKPNRDFPMTCALAGLEPMDVQREYNIRLAKRQRPKINRHTPVTYNGETRTLGAWAAHVGISIQTMTRRFRLNLPAHEALAPVKGSASKKPTNQTETSKPSAPATLCAASLPAGHKPSGEELASVRNPNIPNTTLTHTSSPENPKPSRPGVVRNLDQCAGTGVGSNAQYSAETGNFHDYRNS